jgi:drug/metabolite transporter (DMT)-like permease
VDPIDWLEARTPPHAALAIAIIAVSTSAILVRWSEAPNLVKAFYRVLFTTLLLSPLAIGRYRDSFARLTRTDYLTSGVIGIALAVHFAAWFESLDWTSVAASVTLVQSQPIFVAIGAAAFLDERIRRLTVIGILVALVGMTVMTLPGANLTGPRPVFGNALAVVGAVMAAIYVLAGRSLRQRIDLIPYVIVVYSACAATLLVVTLVEGSPIALTAYPPREWLLFLGMAIGPGVLGHTVINWSLKHVESSVVSVSLLGEPVGSAILAAWLLAEIPGLPTILGGAIVLTGIYVTSRGPSET